MNSHLLPEHRSEECWCHPQVIIYKGEPVSVPMEPLHDEDCPQSPVVPESP